MKENNGGVGAPTEASIDNINVDCSTLKSFVDDRLSMFDDIVIAPLDDIKEMS